MDFVARILLAALGTAACVGFVRQTNTANLLAAVVVVIAVHALCERNRRRLFQRFLPVLVFAAGVYVLSFFGKRAEPRLPLQVIFVFASIWMLARLCARNVKIPRSRILFRLFLFACFVRHFAEVLGDETRQTFIARQMAAPSLFRSGGFSSLVYALSSIFQRCMTRAERFYAAQSLKGLSV